MTSIYREPPNPLPRNVEIYFTFLARRGARPGVHDCFFSLRDIRYANHTNGLRDPGCLDRGDIFEVDAHDGAELLSERPILVKMLMKYKAELVECGVV